MRNLIYILLFLLIPFASNLKAQYDSEESNDEDSYDLYSLPNLDNRYQSGYFRSDGTFVMPHFKTNNNETNWDNYSTEDNYNLFTGENGYRAKDYSSDAFNYGDGRIIYTGPRGGQYYINSKGNKVYVPKR